jgi:hypothetical protein
MMHCPSLKMMQFISLGLVRCLQVMSLAFHEATQQSVHRTAGTLRVFGAGSELWQFPVSSPFSLQPPVTQAVGQHKRFT